MIPLKIGQIGVGGYGLQHVRALTALADEGRVRIAAFADPVIASDADVAIALAGRGAVHYKDYREMLRAETLDAVSIAAPIPFHAEMIEAALEAGLHVLTEKPPVVLLQDLDRLADLAARKERLVQVGFQQVLDAPAQDLKKSLLENQFGRIRKIVVIGLWRRLDSYYARASWAGRLRLGDRWALDGPLNNPLIHYMHQGLFFAGPEPHATAVPLRVQAELYRAHPIEGEDTLCIRAWLQGDIEMLTYLTLCARTDHPPTVEVICDDARVRWQTGSVSIHSGGVEAKIESPEAGRNLVVEVFRNFMDGLTGRAPLKNPLSASRNILLHNNAAYLSSQGIRTIPDQYVRRYDSNGSVATEVEELEAHMRDAAQRRKLLSETGVPWAVPSRVVEADFASFDPSFLLE